MTQVQPMSVGTSLGGQPRFLDPLELGERVLDLRAVSRIEDGAHAEAAVRVCRERLEALERRTEDGRGAARRGRRHHLERREPQATTARASPKAPGDATRRLVDFGMRFRLVLAGRAPRISEPKPRGWLCVRICLWKFP